MHIGQRYWRRQGLGTKLAITNFVWVAAILAALLLGIAWSVTRVMEHKVQNELEQGVSMLGRFIEANDRDLRQRTQFLADSFAASLNGTLELDRSAEPLLRLDGVALNGDNARIDRFTRATGAVATVFMRQGDDYLRVASSLKTDKGEPATGTQLDRQHPAYAEVQAGRSYMGLAMLFGRQYMTQYRPLKDASGAIVGMAFVGQDFSELLNNLKASIRALKVGEGGYYYVLRNDAAAPGTLVVHPSQEGQSILESRDSDGRAFIREILSASRAPSAIPGRMRGVCAARQAGGVWRICALELDHRLQRLCGRVRGRNPPHDRPVCRHGPVCRAGAGRGVVPAAAPHDRAPAERSQPAGPHHRRRGPDGEDPA
jgi:methyl-accepting chemotaxis protein-2 (aspartate sensor receptor)